MSLLTEEQKKYIAELERQLKDSLDEVEAAKVKEKLNFIQMGEEDYIGANITNLGNDPGTVRRKASYIPPFTAAAFAEVEMVTSQLGAICQPSMDFLFYLTEYTGGEGGKAMADMNTTITGKGSKHYPNVMQIPDQQEVGGL